MRYWPGSKPKIAEHEIFGDLLEGLDTTRRGEFDALSFERAFPRNRRVVTHFTSSSRGTTMASSTCIFKRHSSQDRATQGYPGSIASLGCRFRSFGLNELEMVALTGASWNRMLSWLRQVEALSRAASAFLP
jgi:hypothetical protein